MLGVGRQRARRRRPRKRERQKEVRWLGEFVFNPTRYTRNPQTQNSFVSKNYSSENENENESKVGIKRTMPAPARVMVVSGDGKDGIFIRVV